MKNTPFRFLTMVAVLSLPCALVAAPDTVLIRSDVICLPKASAELILNAAEIKQHPELVLAKLQQLTLKHQAVTIGSPGIHEVFGFRGRCDGLVNLVAEAKGANLTNFDLNAEIKYAGQQLTVSSPAALGTVVFAGTFTPGKDAPANAQGGTCLVFVQVQ
jgi:hypothetical protein